MKRFLTGVVVCAALAFSAPAGAQQFSPGGNAVGCQDLIPEDRG
jgi:hypothetical protein